MGAIKWEFPGLPDPVDDRTVEAAERVAARREIGTLAFDEALAVLARRKAYVGVYTDLQEAGLPVPAVAVSSITREALVAHLQQVVGDLVAKDLADDPDDLYSGAHDHAHVARLFSEEQSGPGHDGEGFTLEPSGREGRPRRVPAIGKTDVDKQGNPIVDEEGNPVPWKSHRIHAVLRRIPYAPNALTAADIAAAKGA